LSRNVLKGPPRSFRPIRLAFLQSCSECLTSTPRALAIRLDPAQCCSECLRASQSGSKCHPSRFGDPARSGSVLLRMPQSGSKSLRMPPLALWRSGWIRLNVAQNASKWLTFHTRGRHPLRPDPDCAIPPPATAPSSRRSPVGMPCPGRSRVPPPALSRPPPLVPTALRLDAIRDCQNRPFRGHKELRQMLKRKRPVRFT
jgi:hypothetical protein